MSYEVGVFSRTKPSETREVEDTSWVALDQAEAEALAESPLPPDPGEWFAHIDLAT